MANDQTRNPWIIDTASPAVISNDIYTRINLIRWVVDGDAADGDDLIIKDADDNVLFHDIIQNSNATTFYVGHFHFTVPLNLKSTGGIKVTTLSHGKVYIYME